MFDVYVATFLFDGAFVVSPAVPASAQAEPGMVAVLRLPWLDAQNLLDRLFIGCCAAG